jgi:hypothetical protein
MIRWKARKKELKAEVLKEVEETAEKRIADMFRAGFRHLAFDCLMETFDDSGEAWQYMNRSSWLETSRAKKILDAFEKRMRKMMATEIQLGAKEYIAREEFIESIIDRINRKQLKGKE